MKASDFLRSLPAGGPSPEREAMVLEAILRQDIIPPAWTEVRTEARGHHGVLYVGTDTLQVGEPGDSIRVMVSAAMWQIIADAFGWILPTVRISDLIHAQAVVVIEPVLTAGDERMDYYVDEDRTRADDRMVHVNAEIDRRIACRQGLASSYHKDWTLTKRLLAQPGCAANYGYFSAKAPYESHSGERMWQTLGTRHNAGTTAATGHRDNSQQLRPILGAMAVDDAEMQVGAVMMSQDLSELVSDEGALPFCRHPGVPLAIADTIPPEAA